MAALAEHVTAVLVLVLDRVVIIDLAMVDSLTNLASTHALATGRVGALDPVDDIEVVDVLLGDVIATQPDEVVPVTHLVFHLGELSSGALLHTFAITHPDASAVPIGTGGNNVTDRPVVNLLHDLLVTELVMTLKTNAHFQILLLRFLRSSEHLTYTLSVHGHRFFHEDVLALLDRLGKVHRAKTRRRREDDHVSQCDGFFVGVEPDELVLILYIHLEAMGALQILLATVHAILEGIGHGNHFHIAVGAESLIGCAGTTATTTNQSHLDGVTGLCERAALDRQTAQRRRSGTGLDEITTIERRVFLWRTFCFFHDVKFNKIVKKERPHILIRFTLGCPILMHLLR